MLFLLILNATEVTDEAAGSMFDNLQQNLHFVDGKKEKEKQITEVFSSQFRVNLIQVKDSTNRIISIYPEKELIIYRLKNGLQLSFSLSLHDSFVRIIQYCERFKTALKKYRSYQLVTQQAQTVVFIIPDHLSLSNCPLIMLEPSTSQ